MGPDLRQGNEVGLFGLGGVICMGPDLRQGDEKEGEGQGSETKVGSGVQKLQQGGGMRCAY